MVKKLYKYEFLALLRTLLPVYVALFGVALLSRFLQIFENKSVAYTIVFGSSCFAYGVTVAACVLLTLILCVVRIYRSLFSGEGYLTFTLPVSVNQHILTKVSTAVAMNIITFIAVLFSVFIITFGEVFKEILNAAAYLTKKFFELGAANTIFYTLEIIVLILVGLASQYLLYLACMSIGQLSQKNRIGIAVAVYFGYYMITQILYTIFVVVSVSLSTVIDFGKLFDFIAAHKALSVHFALLGSIVLEVILGVVFYIISSNIMRKKLNLE